jgi:hypothetical protein
MELKVASRHVDTITNDEVNVFESEMQAWAGII